MNTLWPEKILMSFKSLRMCVVPAYLTFTLILLPQLLPGQEKPVPGLTDSLEKKLSHYGKKDTARISLLRTLAWEYAKSDAFKSIEYAREAVETIHRLGLREHPEPYFIMGMAYDRVPDYKKATENFRKGLAVAQQNKDLEGILKAYDYLGWHYARMQEYGACKLNFEMELETAQMMKNNKGIASADYGLARVYYIMEDWEKLKQAITSYLDLSDELDEPRRTADAWRLMGEYYRNTKVFGDAIECYQKCYETAEAVADTAMMGIALNHMAWTYYEKGDLDKSLEVYNRSFDFTLPQGRAQTLANIYGNIGNIYRDWERYPEAMQYYKKSIEISEESGDIFNLSWVYEDLSLMDARMGNYKKAYENFKLHAMYSDSMTSINYRNRMMEARNQYESEKKTRELELLNLRLERNRLLIYSLTGGIVLLLILGFILISYLRNKSKRHLEEMNLKISELNQANLRQQMNPHFIFNTLNSIQYYVFQNDKISSNNYMTKFAALIRKTLENSRHTAISIKEELDALELYLELEALRFKEKFTWEVNVDDEIDTLSFKIPTMLIQPFVENSITHGLMNKEDGKGNISIDLTLKDEVIVCTIEDNGIGRQRAEEIKQEKNSNHKSLGTTITESRLRLVNELYGKSMKVRYTDLMDDEGHPAGTRVQINIPIIT